MARNPADLRSIEPSRVLIVKPSSLGDVVHALPTLAALKHRWPSARFSWLVNKGLRGLLDGNPHLDEVIPFDRRAIGLHPRGLRAIADVVRELRSRRFDLAIDLQGLLRSGLLTAATGARVRVGLATAREGSTRFYTHRIGPPAHSEHAVDRLLEVASALGADVSEPRFDPVIADADRQWARARLQGAGRPLLVLNVGARWLTKRWPPESFAAVARRAIDELGASVIAVGATEDQPLVEAVGNALRGRALIDLAGQTTLPQLAAIAAECDLFLSNDTGPLHLAAATGSPVVGVYTCTRPEWTGPYGRNASACRTKIHCAGSCVKTCSHMECMAELTSERVWKVVRPILARVVRPRTSAA
jgi:lipopolysaccharide heptosyltransferase I